MNFEAVIAALMLYSDSTSLTAIGNKSIHCMYLYLGNHEIGYRQKPKNAAAHLLAYLPHLPTKEEMGVMDNEYRIMKRELFQEILKTILGPLVDTGER